MQLYINKLAILIGTVALAALAACSADETVNSAPVNPDEIRFRVIADNASRSYDLFSNSNLPDTIYIVATKTGTSTNYFNMTPAIKNSEGEYVLQGMSKPYWPSVGLDFFAIRGLYSLGVEVTSARAVGRNYLYSFSLIFDKATVQHDLLYAVTFNATKDDNGGAVNLNFRHGLAQLAFKAQSENPRIYVEISRVEVVGIYRRGTFNFGSVPTFGTYDGNTYSNYQSGSSSAYTSACSWTNLDQKSANGYYYLDFDSPIGVKGYDTSTTTASAVDLGHSGSRDNCMFMIPQPITAWQPASDATPGDSIYFRVFTKIRNIATPNASADNGGVTDTDKYIYGSASDFSAIYITVPHDAYTAWEAGKKYTYNFIFGRSDGNNYGGTDSSGNPVLVPLSITADVTAITDGNASTATMTK